MSRVAASIPVLCWAAERAGLSDAALEKRFPRWQQWLSGLAQPTLRQLEQLARLTHTPIGYFFLPEPPHLELPVPDLRTLRDAPLAEPSSELLDILYLCQQRQDWFREYALLHGFPRLDFTGSVSIADHPETVAAAMRERFRVQDAAQVPTWLDALRHLVATIEENGVMVMISSIVGSNSHRRLEVEEFRGFSLADDLAPLIFVNGSDSKSAQMFTLIHELAHVWLGKSGVSDSEIGQVPEQQTEKWCNEVAAEFLVPLARLREVYAAREPLADELQRLARIFKVSTLVVVRRLFDAGIIGQDIFREMYRRELERIRALEKKRAGGGDFYRTLGARTGKLFARALLASAFEGQTLFRDAFRLLGIRKVATFHKAARELGVMP